MLTISLGIGPTGVVRNKSEVVADFTSHALTYQSITTSRRSRASLAATLAVETGRSTMVGQDRGQDRAARQSVHTRLGHDGWALRS